MNAFALLGAACLLIASPAFAQTRAAADAERAYQEVDFPNTHVLAQRALEEGGSGREQTARLYVLLGISSAAQGNTDEAKQDFIVALAVNPELKLDKSISPKFRDPYLEAQGYWAASSERLALGAKPGRDADHLIVRLVDPASLVAKVELQLAARGVSPRPSYEIVPAPATRFAIPAAARGHDYEYALRAVDRYGNVLIEQGSDADPLLGHATTAAPIQAPPGSAPNATQRSYFLPITLGVAGLGAAAVGVVFHAKREQAAHDWNGPGCENPGQTRLAQCHDIDHRRQTNERLAIGFYAAGGALLTGSLIALIAGRPHAETEKTTAGLRGCSFDGTGLSCDGRF